MKIYKVVFFTFNMREKTIITKYTFNNYVYCSNFLRFLFIQNQLEKNIIFKSSTNFRKDPIIYSQL